MKDTKPISKESFSYLIMIALTFAALFYALSIGNGIEPSALLPKLQADVNFFNEGATFKPLLPQPPMG